jgi:malate dehydrogenase
VVSLRMKTAPGDCVSVAVASSGEYGAPEGLQFGFPVVADGAGGWTVAENFVHDDFARERIAVTTEELLGERHDVQELGLID